MSILAMRNWLRSQGRERFVWIALIVVFVASCFVGYGAYNMGPRSSENDAQNYVAATVNGEEIPGAVVDDAFRKALEMQKAQGSTPSVFVEEPTRMQILNELVTGKLVAQIARQNGLRATNDTVNQVRDSLVSMDFKRAYPYYPEVTPQNENAIREDLKKMNVDYDTLKARLQAAYEENGWPEVIHDMAVFQEYQKSLMSKAVLSDKEFLRRFQQVTARRIVIFSDKVSDAQAEKRAKDIVAMAAGGTDFISLVKKYSQDKSGAATGGVFTVTGMSPTRIPVLDKALFEAQSNKVSGPFKVPGGYVILKVENSKITLPPDYEKKKAEYRKQAESDKLQSILGEEIQKIQDTAKIDDTSTNPIVAAFKTFSEAQSMPATTPALQAAQNVKLKKAISLYQEAAKNPTCKVAWARIGTIYQDLMKDPKGKPYYEKAVEAYNKAKNQASDPDIYLRLARVYKDQKKNQEAIAELTNASNAFYGAQNVNVHIQLKQAFKELGDTKNAANEDKLIASFNAEIARRQAEMREIQESLKTQAQSSGKTPAGSKTGTKGNAKP